MARMEESQLKVAAVCTVRCKCATPQNSDAFLPAIELQACHDAM